MITEIVRFVVLLAVILAACRSAGWVFRKLGQPDVIGEMIAGALLGPTLLGKVWPEAFAYLCRGGTGTTLSAFDALGWLSQAGVVIYMLLVGLELDRAILSKRAQSGFWIAVGGIAVPLAAGCGLAAALFPAKSYFQPGVTLFQACLFLGIAMCITALPVLARILSDFNQARSLIGTIALGAAAVDDVAGFALLAVLMNSFAASQSTSLLQTALPGFTIAAVLLGRRQLFGWIELQVREAKRFTPWVCLGGSAVIGCCLVAAKLAGLHLLFGAFVVGIAFPRGLAANLVLKKVMPLASRTFAPLYFAYSGMSADLTVAADSSILQVTLLVTVAALLSKGLGCTVAARLSRFSWRESLGLGALMNARGLVELLVINLAREMNLIQPMLYSVLIIMAIATTMLSAPLYRLVIRLTPEEAQPA